MSLVFWVDGFRLFIVLIPDETRTKSMVKSICLKVYDGNGRSEDTVDDEPIGPHQVGVLLL